MMLVSVNSVQKSYGYFFDIFELVSVVVFALFLFIPNKAPFLIYFHYMGDPVILASKSAAWFEGRARHVAPGGGDLRPRATLPSAFCARPLPIHPNLIACSTPYQSLVLNSAQHYSGRPTHRLAEEKMSSGNC